MTTTKFNCASNRQTAQLLQLSYSLENALGAGVITAPRKANQLGWTSEQLLTLSAAKSLYN